MTKSKSLIERRDYDKPAAYNTQIKWNAIHKNSTTKQVIELFVQPMSFRLSNQAVNNTHSSFTKNIKIRSLLNRVNKQKLISPEKSDNTLSEPPSPLYPKSETMLDSSMCYRSVQPFSPRKIKDRKKNIRIRNIDESSILKGNGYPKP